MYDQFKRPTATASPDHYSITWKSPSNIALVKYWGKREGQLPENPSVSFTLDHCATITTVHFSKKQTAAPAVAVFLDGVNTPSFAPKILQFLQRIAPYTPYLNDYSLEVHTHNSFPHSSGIASSASGMSALALCIMSLEETIYGVSGEGEFNKKASFLARLGSGSACRSIEGPLVCWGTHNDIEGSSDLYGVGCSSMVDPEMLKYRDTILLVDKGEKQVSSSVGHGLMHGHAYAGQRFIQAGENLASLMQAMATGDRPRFIQLVESEALTLHAMMMTSVPYFMLMKPNTMEIINRVWEYRRATDSGLCFTLDAGANVHLLYPDSEHREVTQFIEADLKGFCQNGEFIADRTGKGAVLVD